MNSTHTYRDINPDGDDNTHTSGTDDQPRTTTHVVSQPEQASNRPEPSPTPPRSAHPLPVLVLNGVNLNTLGIREPEIYGHATLAEIITACENHAHTLGATIVAHQTNNEGEFIEYIHQARGKVRGIIINPGAWTHTSIAIADALAIAAAPIVEVHLSNVYQREAFRQISYVSPLANAVISGLGPQGYLAALNYLVTVIP